MKKVLTFGLLGALAFSVFLILPARADQETEDASVTPTLISAPAPQMRADGQEMERIHSPEEIRYFKVMKNENGTLYGIRLQSAASSTPALSNNASSTLERIPSPEQIRYFKVIKKEDGALYGFRIHQDGEENEDNGTVSKEGKNDNESSLEKIEAPEFIKNYKNIRRIGNALWGEPKESEKSPASRLVSADMVTCVSSAISKKDQALEARTLKLAQELQAAISTRSQCQLEAIKSTDNQKDNLDACIKAFKTSSENSAKAGKDKQKQIWSTYQQELKACAPQTASSTGELMIEDGGSSSMENLDQ